MSASELAVRLAALSVLKQRVAAEESKLKREVAGLIGVGDRTTARLPSGTKVGSITYSEGRRTAVITDPRAFLQWVQVNHPEEVRSHVNPVYERMLLDYARNESPSDPVNGEIIPGIEVRVGDPYLTVKPTAEPAALAELVDAIRANGVIALDTAAGPTA